MAKKRVKNGAKAGGAAIAAAGGKTSQAEPIQTPGDTEWFVHDRFGLFIHWGIYALAARHEWVKQREQIPD